MVVLTVAARDSFMIAKRESARELSISGGKFVVAMTVAAFSLAVGLPRTEPWRLQSFPGLDFLTPLWYSFHSRLGVKVCCPGICLLKGRWGLFQASEYTSNFGFVFVIVHFRYCLFWFLLCILPMPPVFRHDRMEETSPRCFPKCVFQNCFWGRSFFLNAIEEGGFFPNAIS